MNLPRKSATDRRPRSAGRTITRRLGKALLGLILVLAPLVGVGAVHQAVATGRAQRTQPAPGAMVDVDGHRMHIACAGQGSPTVVLDAALGNMSAHWVWVQQEVARTTRVCAYDRAGLGWSEPGPGPRDAEHVVAELHTLLANAGIAGPYVLVGHSFGGLYTQLYAARHADEAVGVVLVESSHPEQFTRLPGGQQNYQQTRRLFAVAPLLTWAGVVRLLDLNPPPPGLPPEQRAQIEAWAGSTRHASTTSDEFAASPATTAQVGAVDNLGDRPLAVVTAGEQGPDWLALQNELAALSTNSSHYVVDGATHTAVVDDPGHARTTTAAVLQVVDAVRTDRPLAR